MATATVAGDRGYNAVDPHPADALIGFIRDIKTAVSTDRHYDRVRRLIDIVDSNPFGIATTCRPLDIQLDIHRFRVA